jgi:hypothetical protein
MKQQHPSMAIDGVFIAVTPGQRCWRGADEALKSVGACSSMACAAARMPSADRPDTCCQTLGEGSSRTSKTGCHCTQGGYDHAGCFGLSVLAQKASGHKNCLRRVHTQNTLAMQQQGYRRRSKLSTLDV